VCGGEGGGGGGGQIFVSLQNEVNITGFIMGSESNSDSALDFSRCP
jgi:hypothetical protein